MPGELRKTGIEIIGDVPWATHFCQFYQTKADLLDLLVPYFKAGLQSNEFCMWVTAEPLTAEDARKAMIKVLPDFAKYLNKGQIEILPYDEWYTVGGSFESQRVLNGWVKKLDDALAKGFDGLRLSGNTFWLEKKDWKSFTDYEEAVNNVIGKYKMLALCTYCLDKCNATEIVDVIRNHEFALIKQEGKWELFENSRYKATKEALAESETKFRQLYLSMNEGVALHEIVYGDAGQAIDYVIADVNPAYESITGLKKVEVLGKKASELYRTGEPPYMDIYARVASGGDPTSFETYFPPMEKHFNISVFSPEKGRFATVFSDITRRKQAENTLRDREAEISAILDSAPMLMLMVDSERRVLKSNLSASQFSGRNAGEMNGLRAGEALRCLHVLDDPQGCGFGPACQTCLTRLTVNDTLETGKSHYQVELTLPFMRDGKVEELTFHLYTSALNLPQKRALVCIQDITLLKKKEEEIRVLNEKLTGRALELEAAYKELEAFSYSVSHDLRAPLRSMDGFSLAILEDYADKLDSRGKEYLQYIRSSSQLMARLIDDLLNLSRITRAEMHLGEVNLSDLAEESALELKRNLPDRDIEFVITPGLKAIGDRSLLKVVFINLLGNALKFTGQHPQAKIEFGVTENNSQRAYYLRDNGAGFDMTYVDKLFKPFQRLHSTQEFSGTGIGLALVLRVIHRMGGKIWAEGEVEKGATFYFTLGQSRVE